MASCSFVTLADAAEAGRQAQECLARADTATGASAASTRSCRRSGQPLKHHRSVAKARFAHYSRRADLLETTSRLRDAASLRYLGDIRHALFLATGPDRQRLAPCGFTGQIGTVQKDTAKFAENVNQGSEVAF